MAAPYWMCPLLAILSILCTSFGVLFLGMHSSFAKVCDYTDVVASCSDYKTFQANEEYERMRFDQEWLVKAQTLRNESEKEKCKIERDLWNARQNKERTEAMKMIRDCMDDFQECVDVTTTTTTTTTTTEFDCTICSMFCRSATWTSFSEGDNYAIAMGLSRVPHVNINAGIQETASCAGNACPWLPICGSGLMEHPKCSGRGCPACDKAICPTTTTSTSTTSTSTTTTSTSTTSTSTTTTSSSTTTSTSSTSTSSTSTSSTSTSSTSTSTTSSSTTTSSTITTSNTTTTISTNTTSTTNTTTTPPPTTTTTSSISTNSTTTTTTNSTTTTTSTTTSSTTSNSTTTTTSSSTTTTTTTTNTTTKTNTTTTTTTSSTTTKTNTTTTTSTNSTTTTTTTTTNATTSTTTNSSTTTSTSSTTTSSTTSSSTTSSNTTTTTTCLCAAGLVDVVYAGPPKTVWPQYSGPPNQYQGIKLYTYDPMTGGSDQTRNCQTSFAKKEDYVGSAWTEGYSMPDNLGCGYQGNLRITCNKDCKLEVDTSTCIPPDYQRQLDYCYPDPTTTTTTVTTTTYRYIVPDWLQVLDEKYETAPLLSNVVRPVPPAKGNTCVVHVGSVCKKDEDVSLYGKQLTTRGSWDPVKSQSRSTAYFPLIPEPDQYKLATPQPCRVRVEEIEKNYTRFPKCMSVCNISEIRRQLEKMCDDAHKDDQDETALQAKIASMTEKQKELRTWTESAQPFVLNTKTVDDCYHPSMYHEDYKSPVMRGFDKLKIREGCRLHQCSTSQCLVTKQPCALRNSDEMPETDCIDQPVITHECVDKVTTWNINPAMVVFGIVWLSMGVFCLCAGLGLFWTGNKAAKVAPAQAGEKIGNEGLRAAGALSG